MNKLFLLILIGGVYLYSRAQQAALAPAAVGTHPALGTPPNAVTVESGNVVLNPFILATKTPPLIDGLDVYQPDEFQVRLGT